MNRNSGGRKRTSMMTPKPDDSSLPKPPSQVTFEGDMGSEGTLESSSGRPVSLREGASSEVRQRVEGETMRGIIFGSFNSNAIHRKTALPKWII